MLLYKPHNLNLHGFCSFCTQNCANYWNLFSFPLSKLLVATCSKVIQSSAGTNSACATSNWVSLSGSWKLPSAFLERTRNNWGKTNWRNGRLAVSTVASQQEGSSSDSRFSQGLSACSLDTLTSSHKMQTGVRLRVDSKFTIGGIVRVNGCLSLTQFSGIHIRPKWSDHNWSEVKFLMHPKAASMPPRRPYSVYNGLMKVLCLLADKIGCDLTFRPSFPGAPGGPCKIKRKAFHFCSNHLFVSVWFRTL